MESPIDFYSTKEELDLREALPHQSGRDRGSQGPKEKKGGTQGPRVPGRGRTEFEPWPDS